MVKFHWGMRACGIFVFWAASAVALPAQTFTTLHSFDGTDGINPEAGLVQGTDGNLYGATYGGGMHASGTNGGTIFKITTSGTLTTLYNFCAQTNCADGDNPFAALLQSTYGDFYGTTESGGAENINNSSCGSMDGCGAVFKITATGRLTTLYSFCSQSSCTDGYNPIAPLVLGTSGKFYGTTLAGGATGDGTVFSITASGSLTTLSSFDYTDGSNPEAGLVQGTNGDFYGTTVGGGANFDHGTVFRITPSGTLNTLYSFCPKTNCPHGAHPSAGLVQGANGDFYGTTFVGGAGGDCPADDGCGTVFKITPSGVLTTLYNFCSQGGNNCTDGEFPQAALTQGTDGNLYGTTLGGGANSGGTVFSITPSGALTTLYSFCTLSGCTDGELPYAALIQDTNGTFYGTTYMGGGNNDGTVFSLSVGLGPFVETQPTSGPVGGTVKILGTDLTGATSVTFNGTGAVFTVNSHSLISATVPTGASTGTVQVGTPRGTLSSNVPFTVN
jgi:uncharacterized repeat protein (TIGR03803 family)